MGFTTLAFRFEGRGSNPGGEFFIFQKKGEIRTFLNEITPVFRSKMLIKFVLGPMGQGVYNFNSLLLLYFLLCAVHYYVLCITKNSTPSVSVAHSTQQQALQNSNHQDACLYTPNGRRIPRPPQRGRPRHQRGNHSESLQGDYQDAEGSL